jgi:RNA polymerase primary sigma factor
MIEYDNWVTSPTPDNMAQIMKALDPLINSEIQRFSGPKPLLRSKARTLAVKAVRTYKPAEGAQLKSWVVTQLQPLSRYGQQLRPVRAPEMAIRQAAEVNRVRQEMSDEMGRDPTDDELADQVGISVKRIQNVRRMVRPAITEGSMAEPTEEDSTTAVPGVSTVNKLTLAEEAVYDSLSPRDRAIFDWKTGKHGKVLLSNQVIAQRLGVTPALISQRSQLIASQIQDLHERQVL